jgi:hypothetical protein
MVDGATSYDEGNKEQGEASVLGAQIAYAAKQDFDIRETRVPAVPIWVGLIGFFLSLLGIGISYRYFW